MFDQGGRLAALLRPLPCVLTRPCRGQQVLSIEDVVQVRQAGICETADSAVGRVQITGSKLHRAQEQGSSREKGDIPHRAGLNAKSERQSYA